MKSILPFGDGLFEIRIKLSILLLTHLVQLIQSIYKNNNRLLKESDINFDKNFLGKPDLSYGWAKLNNEYLALLAYKKYRIKNTIFRPFSGYGSDQDLNYPFPSIIKRAIGHDNKKKFIVWGSGHQMRDFIHIKM